MSDVKNIYRLTYETLKDNSLLSEAEFNEQIECWRNYPNKFQNNDDFFELLIEITFYSGFRSKVVSEKLNEIKKSLGNYQKVKDCTFEDVEIFLKKGGIIANASKVCLTILNARKFDEIINKFGSFKKYLQSFNFNGTKGVWNEDIERL